MLAQPPTPARSTPATLAPAAQVAPAADTVPDAAQLPVHQRWRRALEALARVLVDPGQTEQVLVFTTYANAGSLRERLHHFYDDPRGQRLYAEHRAIDSKSVDLDALAALPVGTLGRTYADFLRSRGLSPDVFEGPPAAVTDPRTAYVIQRMRQTHDLWHVVTGYDTDPASEVVLQAFTFAQLHAPGSLILATLGTLRGTRAKPRLVLDVLAAARTGRRAGHLAMFPWEDHWATPLTTVRTMLGLPVEPRAAA
jgi:ubiquinone biosynthesis protein COQ4